MSHQIRPATLNDAEALARIYAPYVQDSIISFEVTPPSAHEMGERFKQISSQHPWTVWEEENMVLGYAYANIFKNRHAYSWSVESTVYVDQKAHRRGIGKALYLDLFERLKKRGIVNVVGCISLPNDPSVKLHESLGFQKVAHFKNIGMKFNQWWDVGYWQLEIK